MLGFIINGSKWARRIAAGAAALLAALPAQQAAAQSLASYGQTPNQVAVGAALDAVSGTATGDRRAMLDAIRALPTAAARADALGQISPQSYTLLPRLAIQSLDANEAMLHGMIVERRAIAADAADGVPVRGTGTVHMTLLSDLRQARYEARSDRPAARSDSRSLAFAIDVAPRNGAIVGLSFGIDGIDARLDPRRPRITLFNSHIGPYASISNGKAYLDASASYNFAEYRLRRELLFGSFIDRLRVNQDGDSWGASAETGYRLKFGKKTRIQPFVGFHFRYADVSPFQETGGTAALQVARFNTKSYRTSLGARASTSFWTGKWALRPTVQAEWRHELNDKAASRIEARLASRDVATFVLQPNQLARDVATVNIGLTATHNSRTSFRIAYAGDFASDRRTNGFVASVSRRF